MGKNKTTKRIGYNPLTQKLDPDFCKWAWGVDIKDRVFDHPLQLLDIWNRRHEDKLKLSPEGSLFEDLCRMGEVWALEGYPKDMK